MLAMIVIQCLMPALLQNGIPIANAVANVAFNKANKVVSFGSSFVKPCASCRSFQQFHSG